VVAHKRDVSSPLFDDHARLLRRKRASRIDGDLFLHQRAFEDSLDRLADVRRSFSRALIAGDLKLDWPTSLAAVVPEVAAGDPASFEPRSFDLCLSIGGLESCNDVQAAAFALRQSLCAGGLLIGAIVGGNSLPRLRTAMLAADRIEGGATPRLHPSIDGPSLAALLTSVGFIQPVIDVDRLEVAYPTLDRLVGDLRAMGCTNVLAERSRRPFGKRGLEAAREAFGGDESPVVERFELLHFAAWTPEI
jgi:NADH dehydrogenase [ubiquinone] 1 alpha subcomplex assembly factor 5